MCLKAVAHASHFIGNWKYINGILGWRELWYLRVRRRRGSLVAETQCDNSRHQQRHRVADSGRARCAAGDLLQRQTHRRH